MDVGLFVTCLNDVYYPRVGFSVVAVLEHFGCRVSVPASQTCCGQPAYNNGLTREAGDAVVRLARLFDGCEYVVSPSASCVSMVREHGCELTAVGSTERRIIDRFAGRLRDFTEFLIGELGVNLGEIGERAEARTTRHYSCHERCARTVDQANGAAHVLIGPEFVPLTRSEQCCGFGGAFAAEFPEISNVMLGDKIDCIEATACSAMICDEAGCRMNIEGGLSRRRRTVRLVHTAELIAEALGLPGLESG